MKTRLLSLLVPVIAALCCVACKRNDLSVLEGKLREGDIVFRCGRSAKSRVVQGADSLGRYSHVGMMVMSDSGLMVVHAVPGESEDTGGVERIKMERIEAFFAHRRASKGLVVRLWDTVATAKAARYARYKYLSGTEFDHDYDLQDTTMMYCTEFIWKAYLVSGVDITEGKRSEIKSFPKYAGMYIFPSDIYTNSMFTEVVLLPKL